MAESVQDSVKCPNCGTESNATLWESLNSVLNYSEVERLIEGTLFAHECPNCHCAIELTYPCLYNDMENGIMVQYIVDEAKLDEAIGLIEDMAREENERHDGDLPVAVRIVTSHNDLREKALIFKDGFFDMSMEALKAVMMNRFIDEGQIQGSAKFFYSGTTDSGDILLSFIEGERSAETAVPRSLYDRVHAMVDQSPISKEKTYIVDPIWAQLFFQKSAQ